MKKIVIKTVKSLAFVALMFLSSSCTFDEPPKPDKNPIILTSDAQTIRTRVQNIDGISSTDPKDEVKISNTLDRVKNDWINCYLQKNGGKHPNEDINIEVTENTSTESRTLKLIIYATVYEDTLIITQLGKTD